MPTFCRHNRLVANCPICSKEQQVEMRPIVSSSMPAVSRPKPERPQAERPARAPRASTARSSRSPAMRVQRLARGAEDGYSNRLLPGVRSSDDARALASEITAAAARLRWLAEDAPAPLLDGEPEQRAWAVLQAVASGMAPELLSGEVSLTEWAAAADPDWGEVTLGPRSSSAPARLFPAYRAWAGRSGGQIAALTGDAAWTAERRFDRIYERLGLPGLERRARFDFLVVLGATGVVGLHAAKLHVGGSDEVSVAAKRAFGIGDPLLLERRAAELADAAGVEIAALDLALFNWDSPVHDAGGFRAEAPPDDDVLDALGL